jgi:outer membrane receptor for ferrienterochelin and colicins
MTRRTPLAFGTLTLLGLCFGTSPIVQAQQPGAVGAQARGSTPAAPASSSAADTTTRVVELQGVVVSASGFEQATTYAPASIAVVPRQELFRGQVRSLSEAIRNIPGVDIDGTDARSNKTGNRTISLRGLPSDYTLILIDGRRQNVPGTVAPNAFNDASVAFLPPLAAIERIEVVRGPMSTLYGSDALGGVVNIITRRGAGGWVGEAALDATVQGNRSFGGSRGFEGYLAGPLLRDRLHLQAQARRFDRSATEVEFPGQDLSVDRRRTMGQLPTDGSITTGGGRLSFTPGRVHEVYAGADVTRQLYDNAFGQLGQINASAQPGTAGFPDRLSGYDRELGFERDQLYAGHRARFGRALLHTVVSSNRTETTGRTIPTGAATAESGRRGTPRTLESRTLNADSRLTAFLGRHTATVGAEYIDARLTDGIPDRTFTAEQVGLFAENEWRAADRLRLTGGVRYDDHSGFGGQLSPRAYAVFAASPDWTVKGGVARGYRAPTLEQLEDGIIGFGNQGRDPLFGNPELRPEVSTNYELSVGYDRLGALRATVTGFRTELRDKIERPTGATSAVTANIGTALLQGVEFAGNAWIAAGWQLRADYTYTRSEVTTSDVHGINEGDPLFGVPAHMLNTRLRWQATPALDATLGGQFRSARHRPDSFHEPHLGGSAQGAAEALGDFQGYTLLDLGASYRLTRRLQLNATIENLLDRNFVDYRPYPLRNNPNVTAYSNVYNNILEPRRLWIALRASL